MELNEINLVFLKAHIDALETCLIELSEMPLDDDEKLDLEKRQAQIKELKKLLKNFNYGTGRNLD